MPLGGKITRPCALGFGQESLVVGKMQPDLVTVGDLAEAEVSQIGGIRQPVVALPCCDPLGKGKVLAFAPGPFLYSLRDFDG